MGIRVEGEEWLLGHCYDRLDEYTPKYLAITAFFRKLHKNSCYLVCVISLVSCGLHMESYDQGFS